MHPPDKVLRLYPGPTEEFLANDVYADLTSSLPKRLDAAQYVAINMVSTLDGKVSVDGKASSIGSVVDRQIMRNIRCAFDAVLVGAGSLRAEEMNLGVPRASAEKRRRSGRREQPFGVVLAGAKDLPLHRELFSYNLQENRPRTVVIASGSTPKSTLRQASGLGACVLTSSCSELPKPDEILRLLQEHFSVRSLLVEGGPTINASFLSAGKVDDLFMTLSPRISKNGDEAPSITAAFSQEAATTLGLTLTSIHCSPQESELYLRYSFNR